MEYRPRVHTFPWGTPTSSKVAKIPHRFQSVLANARAPSHGKDEPPMTLWIRNGLRILLIILLTACGTVNRPTPYPPQPPRPLTELLTDLHSPDSDTRMGAVGDLWDYGPAAAPAVPDLIAMIDDPLNPYGGHRLDFDNRRTVIDTLAAIGPGAVAAVPTLLMIVQEPQEHIGERENAIRTLGALGDRSVVPQLVPMLRDPDPELTQEVGLTIERLVNQDFPDNGPTIDEQTVKARAILAWWDAEGQDLDWDHP